jgi:hypothetical protein
MLDAHPVERIDYLRYRRCESRVYHLEAIHGGTELFPKRRMRRHGREAVVWASSMVVA